MCGIVAYIGKRDVYPILIKGLQRLEYRGYDSAGIAILDGSLKVYKKAGKVSELVDFTTGKDVSGHIGMGHTRWATHGEPNDRNAHPQLSQSKNFAIIHNGIIENYSPIKAELKKRGHQFLSDTDTEVLIHLIEDIYENGNASLEEAVRLALGEVIGAYAIVILSKEHPNELICARKGSPIVIGVGKEKSKNEPATTATGIKHLWKAHEGGCDACNHNGYKGRVGIYEVLVNSPDIQSMIIANATSEQIQEQAIKEGMITMQMDGFVKALRGITALEEILRVTRE